jgi:hypothetical protein
MERGFLFLLDSGADRTVFSADILHKLGIQPNEASQDLQGVGGRAASVVLATSIRMIRETGDPVIFTGEFAAFTDPKALDMSVLGRDLTNLFAVIVVRPQDIVCLLGAKHRYSIVEA